MTMASTASEPRPSRLSTVLVWFLGLCSLVSVSVNYIHANSGQYLNNDHAIARAMQDFTSYKRPQVEKDDGDDEKDVEVIAHNVPEHLNKAKSDTLSQPTSKLAGLNCDAYGGPEPEVAAEMVYWSDIPSDSEFVSPFHAKHGQHKRYLTFEPDGVRSGKFPCHLAEKCCLLTLLFPLRPCVRSLQGGWNNASIVLSKCCQCGCSSVLLSRSLVLPADSNGHGNCRCTSCGHGEDSGTYKMEINISTRTAHE
jgi:hypothetical protein